MSILPKISDAEWEVMEVIWQQSPISGAQVAEKLADKKQWHVRTVKTMLGRLTRKGVLSYHKNKKTFLYSPQFNREDYINSISKNLIQRIFKGNSSLALLHLVESSDLSATQIAELNQLLQKKLSQTDLDPNG